MNEETISLDLIRSKKKVGRKIEEETRGKDER
jgi:hypothetical protein